MGEGQRKKSKPHLHLLLKKFTRELRACHSVKGHRGVEKGGLFLSLVLQLNPFSCP